MNKNNINYFNQNGYIILKDFFNHDKDILPIQKDINSIIKIIYKKYKIELDGKKNLGMNFASNYIKLIEKNRDAGSAVYDAVKNLYSFQKLITHSKLQRVFEKLRSKPLIGISPSSQGIRIDNPNETKFRSRAHQEFLYQPQSEDGLVFWTPLLDLNKSMGPLKIYKKSHIHGLLRYKKHKKEDGQPLGYSIIIDEDESIDQRFETIEPTIDVGDLIVMDFLTVHASGYNCSKISRWSIQLRYFNFKEKKGVDLGWKPNMTVGTNVEEIFKDKISS